MSEETTQVFADALRSRQRLVQRIWVENIADAPDTLIPMPGFSAPAAVVPAEQIVRTVRHELPQPICVQLGEPTTGELTAAAVDLAQATKDWAIHSDRRLRRDRQWIVVYEPLLTIALSGGMVEMRIVVEMQWRTLTVSPIPDDVMRRRKEFTTLRAGPT